MLTLLLFVIALVEAFAIWALWTHRAPCAAVLPASPAPSETTSPGGSPASGGGTDGTIPASSP